MGASVSSKTAGSRFLDSSFLQGQQLKIEFGGNRSDRGIDKFFYNDKNSLFKISTDEVRDVVNICIIVISKGCL